MTRFPDTIKAATWKQHFDRFQSSGLSVQRFCNLNKLSVHSFQYWAKRLGAVRQPARASTQALGNVGEVSSVSIVSIHFGTNVEIRIPTDQIDTIKSVLLFCSTAQSNNSGSFRSVLIRD